MQKWIALRLSFHLIYNNIIPTILRLWMTPIVIIIIVAVHRPSKICDHKLMMNIWQWNDEIFLKFFFVSIILIILLALSTISVAKLKKILHSLFLSVANVVRLKKNYCSFIIESRVIKMEKIKTYNKNKIQKI